VSGQGVLWDLDGVLVDTGELPFQAWAEVLQGYGLPLSRESFRQTFGMNNPGILSILPGDKLAPQLLLESNNRKERRFRQAVRGHLRPLPGVLP
jgi:beta-phosphoglucomutase-like phosphatase (HAD superfamily)